MVPLKNEIWKKLCAGISHDGRGLGNGLALLQWIRELSADPVGTMRAIARQEAESVFCFPGHPPCIFDPPHRSAWFAAVPYLAKAAGCLPRRSKARNRLLSLIADLASSYWYSLRSETRLRKKNVSQDYVDFEDALKATANMLMESIVVTKRESTAEFLFSDLANTLGFINLAEGITWMFNPFVCPVCDATLSRDVDGYVVLWGGCTFPCPACGKDIVASENGWKVDTEEE